MNENCMQYSTTQCNPVPSLKYAPDTVLGPPTGNTGLPNAARQTIVLLSYLSDMTRLETSLSSTEHSVYLSWSPVAVSCVDQGVLIL